MKAIFIAAGEGSRMGSLTQNIPKPLIDVNGSSILERQLAILRKNSISDIIIITGPNPEKFNFDNIKYVNDKKFKEHDQLGSLMCAKNSINDDVIILFADIIFEESILQQILESKYDITIAVDLNWKESYKNRTDNPFDDADKVMIINGEVQKIFKKIKENDEISIMGEFIGLMKLSKNGAMELVKQYEKIEFSHLGSFHDAESLESAKLIDILQDLIEKQIKINTVSIVGKWCEVDTPEDLNIAKRLFI
jgi:choline kinase